jgi:hypothetical protein
LPCLRGDLSGWIGISDIKQLCLLYVTSLTDNAFVERLIVARSSSSAPNVSVVKFIVVIPAASSLAVFNNAQPIAAINNLKKVGLITATDNELIANAVLA